MFPSGRIVLTEVKFNGDFEVKCFCFRLNDKVKCSERFFFGEYLFVMSYEFPFGVILKPKEKKVFKYKSDFGLSIGVKLLDQGGRIAQQIRH